MKKLFSKIMEGYRNLRLQTKFTFTHLVITTIPMLVLFVFFYGKLYDMVASETIRREQAASAVTVPSIEEIVHKVLDTHADLSGLAFYQELFRSADAAALDAAAESGEAESFRRQVGRLIDGTLITDIHIYLDLPETQKLFSAPGTSRIFLPIRDAQGTYWYGIFQGNRAYNALYCPSFYLSAGEIGRYGDLAYITKSSVFLEGKYHPCYTAIYYSKSALTDLLAKNLTAESSVSYLINDRDSLIATSSGALSGIYHFDYGTVRNSFMSSNNFIQKNVVGKDVYAGFYNIRDADWYMVVIMPAHPMVVKSIWITMGFLLVYLACVAAAFLIATLLSRSITNRISSVIDRMAKARTGPPETLPASASHDEIGNLIDTYNYMAKSMNRLLAEQAKASEDLRIAEFNSLQAQINPHFLYNTMDMINWLAQQGCAEKASRAIRDLSLFYKLTLSRRESVSTVEDEIKHVETYVRLQNMRFHEAIQFLVDIPDCLTDCPIPKLTLQPIVENAVLHGILGKIPQKGAIVLTGWLEADAAVLLISDSGAGIPPEKLRTILTKEGRSGTGTNVAVYNVHRRLQLLYGARYGLSYQSVPGKGTDVEIRIPLRSGDRREPGG